MYNLLINYYVHYDKRFLGKQSLKSLYPNLLKLEHFENFSYSKKYDLKKDCIILYFEDITNQRCKKEKRIFRYKKKTEQGNISAQPT